MLSLLLLLLFCLCYCTVPEVIDTYNTQVRLVNPVMQETSSGYVEVFVNNDWGTVCNMGLNDASTACRQLGYTGATSAQDMANYT